MENVQQILEEIYAETNGYNRVKFTLKEPKVTKFCNRTKIDKRYNDNGRLVGWTNTIKPKKEYILFLKRSTTGEICLSSRDNARYVYPYWVIFKDSEIESIERYVEPDKNKNWKEYNIKYLINNTHPNIWEDFIKKLKETPIDKIENYWIPENHKIRILSLSSKLPEWVCGEIKDAIENKKKFSYKMDGIKRDISVEINFGDDGLLRAWYNSYYSGWLNGAYFIIINPKIAVFTEYD